MVLDYTTIVLLTIREDAGFQAAGILGWIGLWRGKSEGTRAALPDIVLALGCAAMSIIDFVLQKHSFPSGGNGLASVYLGSPPLAHLTSAFISRRLHLWFYYRNYIWAPLMLAAFVAASTRDLRLALGSLACLPWLTIAFIAVQDQAGNMVSYYGLPMTIGLLWPLFAACPSMKADIIKRNRYLCLEAAMTALSIGLFVQFGSFNHDAHPWRSFGFQWAGRIKPMETAMNCILSRQSEFGHLVVDDAVASLRMNAFSSQELKYAMQFSHKEQKSINTLIYQPGTWGDTQAQQIIKSAGLTHKISITKTPFVIRSARELNFRRLPTKCARLMTTNSYIPPKDSSFLP